MEDKVNFVQTLYESGGLWYVLGTLISADTYICSKAESIKRHKLSIETFKKVLELIDQTNMPEGTKEKVKEVSNKGLELLEKELEELV